MNVSNIEIATRRKLVAELKQHLARVTGTVDTEIKRLNAVRPIDRLNAVCDGFNGASYLQTPESLDDSQTAFCSMLEKIAQDARQLERKVLRLETDMRDRDNGTRKYWPGPPADDETEEYDDHEE